MASRYLPHSAFFEELRERVDAHVAEVKPRRWRLFLKTAIIMSWWAGSWVALNFFAQTWWQAGLAAVSLGLGMALIGFNVMHDGGHRAASENPKINRVMALGLDLMGGSSYVWNWKHNVHHHTNPNAVGLDVDIEIEPLIRLAPQQKRYPWHRFQHLYAWFLYSLLAIRWHFLDDYLNIYKKHIGSHFMPRPKGWDMVAFLGGKAVFMTWAVVVPLMLHPVHYVMAGYLVASMVLSLCLAITFQAAHCVVEAEFTDDSTPQVEWAVHQIRTCVDFAPKSKVWNWLLGGLNFQTVHHLFPRLSHVQLAEAMPVVAEVCKKHGHEYTVLPSFGSAVASHGRWLKQMGAA